MNSVQIISDYDLYLKEDLQLAPNGKIYVAKSTPEIDKLASAGVINQPNFSGSQADYQEIGQHLGDRSIGSRLPTFVSSFLAAPPEILYENACTGEPAIFSATGVGSRDSIRWFFADPALGNLNSATTLTATHVFPAPDTYTVTLRVYLGDSFKDLVQEVTIHDRPVVNLGPDLKMCTTGTVELNASEALSYRWSTGETSRTIRVSASGTYWVEASNGFCISRDEVKVEIVPPPLLDLGPDQLICSNAPVTLSVGPDNQNHQIKWSTGETTPSITVSNSGTYWAEVTNEFCTARDEISLQYHPLESLRIELLKTTLAHDEKLTLKALGADLVAWQWNLGDGTTAESASPSHTYANAGTYPITLKATNQNGCTATVTSEVTVAPYISVPNIFTPNGDGLNDEFRITHNVQGPFEVTVYNRWGKKVFQANHKDFNWNGQGCSEGIYFYLIESATGSHKGYVELVR